MKVRITILTESDKPVSALGDNPEGVVRTGWELLLTTLLNLSDESNNDKFVIENVEVEE